MRKADYRTTCKSGLIECIGLRAFAKTRAVPTKKLKKPRRGGASEREERLRKTSEQGFHNQGVEMLDHGEVELT